MATPETTLITRAEVTSIITPATNRVALVLDGSTIELGDTGWRDLSGSLDALVTGRVLVRRQAGTITWDFINIVLAAGASATAQNLLSALPANIDSFLAPNNTYTQVKLNTTIDGRLAVLAAGSPRLDYSTLGSAYSGKVSFPVRGSGAWPGTLPGVADGQPVGV